MSNEGEFYDQLFESFNTLQNESNEKELWKIHQINELMNNFNEKNNSRIVQNGLIVIMAIFDKNLKDTFYLKSKNIKYLNDKEKNIVSSILRDELFT
jgi:hypothetical protein